MIHNDDVSSPVTESRIQENYVYQYMYRFQDFIIYILRKEFNSYPSYMSITWVGAVYAL